jgi:hypothetical protein
MLERLMTVTDILKEVDLILACEKSCANTMHRRIAPTLFI